MKRITAIGEILFDVYPERRKLGGAPFNFIYHVRKLTAQGNFISRIGKDEFGNEIISFLKDNGFSLAGIQIDEEHKTGIAKPVLSDDKIPEWSIEEYSAYDFIEYNSEVEKIIEETACIYFGTLAQRNPKSRGTIQKIFNQKNKIFFCDLNIRQNFYSPELIEQCLNAADVLKLNSDEMKLVNEIILKEKFDESKTPEKIKEKFGIDLLCITNGSEGARIFGEEKVSVYSVKIPEDELVDTVGAGDAFASILCIGYLKEWNVERINKLASEFAGGIVKINGALPGDDSIYEKFKNKIT